MTKSPGNALKLPDGVIKCDEIEGRVGPLNKTRDFYFDNLKAILIFLVILGHFLLPIETGYLQILKRWIYIFHMPLFIFVSGYFSKKVYTAGRMNWQKILYYLKLYVFFVAAIQLIYVVFMGKSFHVKAFIDQSGAPWYLLCLVFWYVSIPLIRKIRPAVAILISSAAALAAGYFDGIGDVLCLSRVFVFGPFFVLGYFCDRKTVIRLTSEKARLPILTVAAAVTVGVFATAPYLPQFMHLVYGNVSYAILDNQAPFGWFLRLSIGLAAVALGLGLMALTPKKKCFLSSVGRNTLPIYILHRLIRDVIKALGFYRQPLHSEIQILVLLICISVFLTWFLSRRTVDRGFSYVLSGLGIS